MEKGYPRRTVNDFPGISQRIDAVFQHKGTGNLGTCFSSGVELNDLLRSLPTPVILWFCEMSF